MKKYKIIGLTTWTIANALLTWRLWGDRRKFYREKLLKKSAKNTPHIRDSEMSY